MNVRWAVGVALAAAALAPAQAQQRSFQAEGTDTGAGLGARYIAQGGTGVAHSDDVFAVFYNPAGLASVEGFELTVSRQLDAKLHEINHLGAAWRLPIDPARLGGLKATVGVAYYPRIHARATGAYDENDFESLFLRYLLPGISGTFDGEIDTKTKSYRAALGWAPATEGTWAAGAYVERIDCQSNFCGVHATAKGFTTQSTRAQAVGLGFGARWHATPQLTLAANVSDLNTRLTVNTVTTDDAGTRTSRDRLQFPRKISVAAAWRPRADVVLASDYEAMQGRYGQSEIDLQVWRLGGEWRRGDWRWRGGAVVPVRIQSSMTGTLHAPFPFSPTLGLGWQSGPVSVDFAVYAHAVMSMHKDRASPSADLSLVWRH